MNIKDWRPFRFLKDSNKSSDTKVPVVRSEAPKTALSHPLATANPLAQMMEAFMRDPFFADPFAALSRDSWFGDFRPAGFWPAVDVSDQGSDLVITAELPGMKAEDIKLAVQDGALVLSGEKRESAERKEDGYYRVERSFGSFQRALPLPGDVDTEHIDADFKDGVLTVRIRRNENAQTARRIPISS